MEDRTREETILFSHSSPPTTTTPPHLPLPGKKIQSYSQQLTHSGSHNSNRNTLPRKHSLEEDRFLLFGGQEYKTRFAEEEKHAQEQEQQQEEEDEQESTVSHTSSYNATTTFHQNSKSRPLPEFIGAGGNDGIFKIPVRAAIPPGRPPSLELRPRPLRDTQTGSFLRVITCSDSQLWAGCESGVRFWNLSDMYMVGGGEVVRIGDVDTTPFFESESTSPVICMTMGMSSKVVWSGHTDGRIRLWNMNQSFETNGNGTAFVEDLMWRAHRGPVLSLAISYYGDLWVGCEGGVVKVWPWETIEQSFSLKEDEKDVASLLLERSYLDLRTKVTVNGVCTLSHADVLYLLSDNSKSKVWSVGHHSFALWDARNRELLKVFNIDGQITRLDMPSPRDTSVEDENNKTKLSSSSKKEKSQSSLTFLQRSRNALMGAADAVRRVAVKGTFADDNQRTEAIVLTGDGMVWTGCSSGLLVQWDGNGNRLRDFNHHPFPVRCLCTLGARMWVGYMTGTVQVLDLDGTLLGEWIAHNSPIINMSVGAGYVFTLASHGGIRGWNIVSPGPIDDVLRSEVSRRESSYTKLEKLKLLAGTWNVGQGKASHDSLLMWLGSASSDVSIVVVGLQEVEMGAGFLAMSAAKETVGIEGTSIGHWWLETIGKHLDEGETFERIGSRQLAGLLIALWARKNLRSHIGDVDAAAVPCGFGHAIGNKGGVGLRVRVYDRIMCFVNCHLAAHLEAVNRRNSDFGHIYRTMTFSRPNQANASTGSSSPTADTHQAVGVHSEDRKPELSEADMVIFLGDLNYRLHGISYEEAKDFVSQRSFDWLKERDQLAAEMKAGKVFQGMREGLVTFPPTYKFEKRLGGLGGYDSSEKKRIPAWCDRILYRDNRVASETKCCLDCPVVSSILQYEACMDVTDSDHKPVRCIFGVDIASIDESARRQNFGWIIQSNEKRLNECLSTVPEITVSTNNIIFQSKERLILRINNACKNSEAYFEIICDGQSTIKEDGQRHEHRSRGSFGFPHWLQLTPAAGVIKSGKSVEVSVNHEESYTLTEFVDGIPQNWWCEGARDKEVTLTLRVRGSCSLLTKSHQIRASHSTYMSKGINSKPKDGRKTRLHHLNSLLEAEDIQQSSHILAMKENCESENQRNIPGSLQSKSLQEPSLLHQNSSSDAANTENCFHTSSLDGNIRNGARNNGDTGIEPMTLFQHLRCFSDAAETKERLHPPSIESNHKNEEGKYTAGGGQSKTTQGTDLQHQSSSHEDTQPSLHSWLTEEKDNHGAQRTKAIGSQSKTRQQSNLTSDKADHQQNLHTPPTEGKSRISTLNAGEIQPKTVQYADLQHPSVSLNSANTQHSWNSPATVEVEKNGVERRDTKGITSKSKQQFDIQPKCSFNAAGIQNNFNTPIEEKYRNGARENDARRIQLKTFQQPDLHFITSSFNSSRGEENNFREIQPETHQQPDLQHINPFSDETETQSSLHTQLTEEKGKNGDQENNAIGIQQKLIEQPDRGHLNPFYDAANNQHSMHDPAATNGTNKNRDRGNNTKEIQPKTREQPDLHHLNPFADAADYQHSLNNSPTEGTSKIGGQDKIAKGTQPKILEQPDLQNSNHFSDAVDNHHSLRNSPTNGVSKNGAQGNNTKGPERPNLQHSNPFSDATGNQHSSHNSLTSKNSAQGNKDKGVQMPNLQQHRPFSDATDDKYSLPNQSKNEMHNYGAQEVNAKGVQSKILEQPDLLHPNPFSDKADNQHNLHDPSTKRMGKNGVQGNSDRVTDYQSTSLVQLKMQRPSHSSGGADTQYRSRCSSTKDKNNNRGQEDNVNRIRTESLQQLDLPQQNHSSNTAEYQYRLYTPSTEETSKVGDQENTYKGNQPRPLQKPDLQYIDCFYDAASTQHIPHMPLEEERSKSGAQISNPGRTQSKASKQLGSEDMVNGFFDTVDSQHSLNTPSTKEKSKSTAQEKDFTTTQSKIQAQSDMQHRSHLSDEADIENRSRTQLIEEIYKKGGQENFNKDIPTLEQPDVHHPSQFPDATDTEHKLQTPSKEKKSKKDAQEKKARGTQPKTLQQLDSQPILSSHNMPETPQSLFTVLTKKKSTGKSKKETQQDSAKGSQSKSQLDSQHQEQNKSKTKSRKDSAKEVQSITPQQPDPSQVVRLCDAAITHQKWRAPTVEDKIKTRARKLYLP